MLKLEKIKIRRIHLEEDTARSTHIVNSSEITDNRNRHTEGIKWKRNEFSLIDFNRAGVPLMELVTEPVMHSAEEAGNFGRELQLLLRTLGVSMANMEKGEMRVEVNISLCADEGLGLNSTEDAIDRTQNVLGTKVEVKNINSFKAAERAIEYEIKRQSKILDIGDKVVQETRGWDEAKQITFSQRVKESSDDYRYFPDPDLPYLQLDEVEEFNIESIRAGLPELPWYKRARYEALGIKSEDARMYTMDTALGAFIDEVLPYLNDEKEIQTASNYISSDLVGLYKEEASTASIFINTERFAELIKMAISGALSSRGVKDVLRIMYKEGGVPAEIAQKEGLLQVRDEGALMKVVNEVLQGHVNVVNEYKKGKEEALKYLVGQGMKLSKGSADPQILEKLIKKSLL